LANGRARYVRTPAPDQVHIDLGALDERVRGAERAIDDVNGRLDNLGAQLNSLSSSFTGQMTRLSEKIDTKMQVKPTNWLGFTTAAAAIVGVLLTIGGAVMVPVFGNIRDLGDSVKEVRSGAATLKELDALTTTVRSREDKLSQLTEDLGRDKIGVREHEEYKAHVADVIAQFASRLNVLAGRINESQERPK